MTEPEAILLVGFIILTLGLTITGYALRKPVLAMAGAGTWVILGVYAYTKSIQVWDIYYSLFFLSMGMVLVCALEPAIMRPKESPKEDIALDEIDKVEAEYEVLRRQMTAPRLRSGRRQKKDEPIHEFHRTGREPK